MTRVARNPRGTMGVGILLCVCVLTGRGLCRRACGVVSACARAADHICHVYHGVLCAVDGAHSPAAAHHRDIGQRLVCGCGKRASFVSGLAVVILCVLGGSPPIPRAPK